MLPEESLFSGRRDVLCGIGASPRRDSPLTGLAHASAPCDRARLDTDPIGRWPRAAPDLPPRTHRATSGDARRVPLGGPHLARAFEPLPPEALASQKKGPRVNGAAGGEVSCGSTAAC